MLLNYLFSRVVITQNAMTHTYFFLLNQNVFSYNWGIKEKSFKFEIALKKTRKTLQFVA